jgi:hypothetical protein
MLCRAVGLDQANVEIEGAFCDRCAVIDGKRQRIARSLRVIDQRPQDRGRGCAAERADKRPVILAGLPLPAAVAGAHPRGVVEKVRRPGQHEILRKGAGRVSWLSRVNSMTRGVMVFR